MYDLQIIGLGSGGAAAMASDLNGLNALMTNDNRYTVFVHCVCQPESRRLGVTVLRAPD